MSQAMIEKLLLVRDILENDIARLRQDINQSALSASDRDSAMKRVNNKALVLNELYVVVSYLKKVKG